jgi:hypothetical protein
LPFTVIFAFFISVHPFLVVVLADFDIALCRVAPVAGNTFRDLLPVNRNVCWRGDTYTYLVPFRPEDGYPDAISDAK